ncbi:non-homologous end-joining DNA ligase [Dyella sp. C9]|uniref:non-homologous end-joining DNA ligase n=1 Tax=Dyella sp. C9 TaxID=2202154 RepID=UPI001E2ED943|nr:non-homologous end-joining DNA ligase [Dyella sp. C9]
MDEILGIAISHPERVIYPDTHITKERIARYYAGIMDWLLPGISGRPTSVLRSPEGIGSKGFFQKHPMQGLKHTGHVRLREENGEVDDYLCPATPTSIIELVQFGVIEFHPWAARATSLEEADYLVFDLDPGDGLSWRDVIEAARHVRERLADDGMRSFVRTTGGKGLHVVVPLHSQCAWTDARQYAQAFAKRLASADPSGFTAKAAKHERVRRIFIDYLRNSRGATSIASFSLRARAGATVAMPLRWEELGKCAGPATFDIDTAPRRLKRLRGHPWEDFDRLMQSPPRQGREATME